MKIRNLLRIYEKRVLYNKAAVLYNPVKKVAQKSRGLEHICYLCGVK
jgi:hypothetical protein